jgi:hypothetical protein
MWGNLFPPLPVLRGRVGVGVGRDGEPCGLSLAAPLAKNPHLNPPPEYRERR